jgi:hypothetical protein
MKELQMWYSCGCALNRIPNIYRSQNHTAYINEVEVRVYELVMALNLDISNWDIYNSKNDLPSSEQTLMGDFKADAN